jgi:ribosomal protein S6
MTFWFNAFFAADFKKPLERALEFSAQLLRVLTVKVRAATEAQNFASEKVELRVVLDFGALITQGIRSPDR